MKKKKKNIKYYTHRIAGPPVINRPGARLISSVTHFCLFLSFLRGGFSSHFYRYFILLRGFRLYCIRRRCCFCYALPIFSTFKCRANEPFETEIYFHLSTNQKRERKKKGLKKGERELPLVEMGHTHTDTLIRQFSIQLHRRGLLLIQNL